MKRSTSGPRSSKPFWDEQHRLCATLPVTWLLKADELLAAFELPLANEPESQSHRPRLSSVAFMLAGFAVEDLIKGLLVQKGTGVESKGRFQLHSHDSLTLADHAALPLTEEEHLLLERLQDYLTWVGRYPIPLTSNPMRPRQLPRGGSAVITFHCLAKDCSTLRTLVFKLKGLLPKVNYDPSAG
jgi:hypothetical protein